MRIACSECGKEYPEEFSSCTCRICGGLIEHQEYSDSYHVYMRYKRTQQWYAWRNKVLSAPPRPLTEADWLISCAHFGGCALCGNETIEEKLLVIPTIQGGKLYTYNVVPTCSECAKKVRTTQSSNPLKAFYKHAISSTRVDKLLSYLESVIDGDVEQFDFDADSIEIVVKVVEDTSGKPFDGVFVRKLYDDKPPLRILCSDSKREAMLERNKDGFLWRLL